MKHFDSDHHLTVEGVNHWNDFIEDVKNGYFNYAYDYSEFLQLDRKYKLAFSAATECAERLKSLEDEIGDRLDFSRHKNYFLRHAIQNGSDSAIDWLLFSCKRSDTIRWNLKNSIEAQHEIIDSRYYADYRALALCRIIMSVLRFFSQSTDEICLRNAAVYLRISLDDFEKFNTATARSHELYELAAETLLRIFPTFYDIEFASILSRSSLTQSERAQTLLSRRLTARLESEVTKIYLV